jgi:hypothetical protein
MGRKGVSKRKPSQNKSEPMVKDNANGSVSSMLQAAESQPAKTFDTGKSAGKSSKDQKNKSKKG